LSRICHLSTVHRADDIRIFHKECKSLASAGYDTHLVISPGRNGKIVAAEDKPVHVHLLATVSDGRLGRMTAGCAAAFRWAVSIGARLYHIHDPELLPWALMLKRRGARVVYDVHEDLPRDIRTKPWIPARIRPAVGFLAAHLEDLMSSRFDAIVTATPSLGRRFAACNRNTVDINNYPLRDEFSVPVPAEHPSGRRVCYVGGINSLRGASVMIAAAEASGVRLALAGTWDSDAERRQMMATDAWAHVDELGHLDRVEVAALLAGSSAGLIVYQPAPNHVDSQPNKLFEYMSAGVPVIASNFPGWRQIVEATGCGLCVDPADVSAVAAAIRWIGDHPEDALRMGARGRQAVVEKFNWEAESRKLIDVYKAMGVTPEAR